MIGLLITLVSIAIYLTGYVPTAVIVTSHRMALPHCAEFGDMDKSYCKDVHKQKDWGPLITPSKQDIAVGMVSAVPWPITLLALFIGHRATKMGAPSQVWQEGIEDRIAETERQAEEALALQRRAQG